MPTAVEFDPEDFDGLSGSTDFEKLTLLFLRSSHRRQREQGLHLASLEEAVSAKIAGLDHRLVGIETRAVVYGSLAGAIVTIAVLVIANLIVHRLTAVLPGQ